MNEDKKQARYTQHMKKKQTWIMIYFYVCFGPTTAKTTKQKSLAIIPHHTYAPCKLEF